MRVFREYLEECKKEGLECPDEFHFGCEHLGAEEYNNLCEVSKGNIPDIDRGVWIIATMVVYHVVFGLPLV